MRDIPECPVCWTSQTERKVCEGCVQKRILEIGGGNDIHQNKDLRILTGYKNLDRVGYPHTIVADLEGVENEEGSFRGRFADRFFDMIYTSHCLEHVVKLKEVLNESHRILKPGGVLEVLVPHKDSDKAYAIDHVRVFTRETWKSLEYRDIADYGFKPWKILYLEGEKDDAANPELRVRMTPN